MNTLNKQYELIPKKYNYLIYHVLYRIKYSYTNHGKLIGRIVSNKIDGKIFSTMHWGYNFYPDNNNKLLFIFNLVF